MQYSYVLTAKGIYVECASRFRFISPDLPKKIEPLYLIIRRECVTRGAHFSVEMSVSTGNIRQPQSDSGVAENLTHAHIVKFHSPQLHVQASEIATRRPVSVLCRTGSLSTLSNSVEISPWNSNFHPKWLHVGSTLRVLKARGIGSDKRGDIKVIRRWAL